METGDAATSCAIVCAVLSAVTEAAGARTRGYMALASWLHSTYAFHRPVPSDAVSDWSFSLIFLTFELGPGWVQTTSRTYRGAQSRVAVAAGGIMAAATAHPCRP
ncbi:hypothetical protein LZ30DRAFT_200631 [Colletotrichum cereale]|nr:hypothetical protein LZ30DRAFT_200631 [Colletotrichum cereale]